MKMAAEKLAVLRVSLMTQIDEMRRSIGINRHLAVGIVLIGLLSAYSKPGAPSYEFVMFLPLLILQGFASLKYNRLMETAHRCYAAGAGAVGHCTKIPIITPVSLAVKDTYFYLFICFDSICLLKPYIHPASAVDFNRYCERLGFGFVTGEILLIFSIVFWIVYIIFFVMGSYRCKDLETWQNTAGQIPIHVPFSIDVKAYKNKRIHLNGIHIPNKGKQPLILWPGLFQNGFVYHLIPGEVSLAEYLWSKGFDIFIIHSRGTGGSGGIRSHASMDNYAAFDIPTVIDYVTRHTGKKPLYFGHSQGGTTAIISMMGVQKPPGGPVSLSDRLARQRQESLKGMVTIGSYPDLKTGQNKWLKNLVEDGVKMKIFGKSITILSARMILFLTKGCKYLPMPVGMKLRHALLEKKYLKILLAPIYFFLNAVARLKLWEFLYHIPNVSDKARRYLFYRTMDGTFFGILNQFQHTARHQVMVSYDQNVNYSENYHRLSLPVSFVGMEFDPLADAVKMKENLFTGLSSKYKYFTFLKDQGHEDFFMDSNYFPRVLEAIKKVDQTQKS
jgi:pimeloyl-ACP methyl ester carboxylesterase